MGSMFVYKALSKLYILIYSIVMIALISEGVYKLIVLQYDIY